ncbi:MAG: phosphatase PAP2 family protein [Hyphomicrobiales bacterium]|nr:phosphatase PAP2 family protein [Hyphomicrobiales bacterium]
MNSPLARRFALTIALTASVMALFAARPELDLSAAAPFFDHGRWIGDVPLGRLARKIGIWLPILVAVAFLALYLAKRFFGWRGPAPDGRKTAYVALALILGPGLLVNVVLKDHWHRPRPYQTAQFGGPDAFRPWELHDGACATNCSFPSGEASGAFFLVAPASLAPPPWQAPAVAAAIAFGAAVGLLRMAFGGHYLSDVLLGGLSSILLAQVLWAFLIDRPKS